MIEVGFAADRIHSEPSSIRAMGGPSSGELDRHARGILLGWAAFLYRVRASRGDSLNRGLCVRLPAHLSESLRSPFIASTASQGRGVAGDRYGEASWPAYRSGV